MADVTEVGWSGDEFPSSGCSVDASHGGVGRRRRLRDLREHLQAFAGAEVSDVVEVHRRGYQLLAIGAGPTRGGLVACR